MSDRSVIEFDDGVFRAAAAELIKRAQDLRPLTADIAESLVESTQKRFITGTAPDGVPWPALKDGSGRTPLLDTGTMRDQIFPGHGPDYAEVVASAKQARWHQFGTDPYVILPTNGKALAFGGAVSIIAGPRKGQAGKGTVVSKVNHPGLPARPFMGISVGTHVRRERRGKRVPQLTRA